MIKNMKKKACILSSISFLALASIPSISIFNIYKYNKENHHRVIYHPLVSPNDPYYTGQSTMSGSSQKIVFNHIGDIEAVWDNYTGKGVTIAIIDTGIDITSNEFTNNISDKSCYIYTTYDEIDEEIYETHIDVGLDKLKNPFEENTYVDHGTSIAGVIAAEKDGEGMVGIAYDATLLVIKCDLYDPSINEAIKYATDNGADIINMSFGAYTEAIFPTDVEGVDYSYDADTVNVEAINYAHEHGVILFSAAGNENVAIHSYPVCNDYVIGVGALAKNSDNEKASYSNYNLPTDTPYTNPSVDVVAPGTVLTTSYVGTESHGRGSYAVKSGTSFSTPIVAAAAALWLEKNPNGTPDEFEEALYNSASDIGRSGWDTTFGWGALDVKALLEYENTPSIIEVEDLILNKEEITLNVGESFKLEVTISPENADFDGKIEYFSENNDIASIDANGNITAINKGEVNIKIKYKDIIKNCHVTVNKPNVTCGGNVYTTSIFLSLISLLGLFIIIYNKKKMMV